MQAYLEIVGLCIMVSYFWTTTLLHRGKALTISYVLDLGMVEGSSANIQVVLS